MPDDLVPPIAGDEPRGGLTCDFCGCALTKAGEVKALSAKAKKIRRMEEDLERAQADVSRLTAEGAELRVQLEAAKAALPPAVVKRRDWLAD